MIRPTYTTETKLLKDYKLIVGIDEVGRAPLAGPVVSAAVILNPNKIGRYRSKTKWWEEVRDSKMLSEKKREDLVGFIKENSLDFGIGEASEREIDEFNIHHASLISMKRAIANLKFLPDMVLIDGKFTIDDLKFTNQKAIVDGDAHILSIAAASIIAKVYRDDLMKQYSSQYDAYGFEKHKGYDTSLHRKGLFGFGPCEIHRMSFETVKEAVSQRFQKMLK